MLAGTELLDNCQPTPGTREPVPKLVQLLALVEDSKVARQISGLAPPRSQVIVEPSQLRLWLAGLVLLSRPMLFRAWPP